MKTIRDMKEDLKQMSSDQKSLKMCRKTNTETHECNDNPKRAALEVVYNKEKIRAMFVAYGLLRGKTFEQIEDKAKTEPNWTLVDKYKNKYGEVVYNSQE